MKVLALGLQGTLNILLICLLAAAGLLAFVFYNKAKKLNLRAYTDSLTQGLSKKGFEEKGGALLAGKASSYSLVAIKAQRLSAVERNYGGKAYEKLSGQIYSLLKEGLASEELIARVSKESYLMLLQATGEAQINAKIHSFLFKFKALEYSGDGFCQFGVYNPFNDDENISDIIEKAQIACYESKIKKAPVFYTLAFEKEIKLEAETAAQIEKGLKTGEFTVYYQPKVRMSDRRVTSAEALVRWKHPLKGILTPNMFLDTAEKYGHARDIDRLVFKAVVKGIAKRIKEDFEECPVSVNLSASSIRQEGLADELFEICRQYEVPASLIEIEISEQIISENYSCAKDFIERLHFYGFKCAMDNFGAVGSSLQLLTSCNVDTLKLDSSFFEGENNSRQGRCLIESVLRLSATLQIHTVAECIGSRGQLEYLQSSACDTVQGFTYFKPMPMDRFEDAAFEDGLLKFAELSENTAPREGTRITSAEQSAKKSVILFNFNPHEDTIEFSDAFSPVFAGQTFFEKASSLFRSTDLIHENDRKDFTDLLLRCQHQNGWVENTVRVYMAHGRYEWLEARLHFDKKSGLISGMLADMSGWKNEVNRWKEQATRDALTGLYNRAHFEQNTRAILKKGEHKYGSFIFVDVDNFKTVNDSYGHMFGDDVLCFISKQLLGIFRHSDIIARYGGDEFVIFAPSLDKNVLVARLTKLMDTFKFPYRSGGTEHNVSVTVGAAFFPDDGDDYDILLDHADCALYEAKERGKKRFVLYEPHMKGEGK